MDPNWPPTIKRNQFVKRRATVPGTAPPAHLVREEWETQGIDNCGLDLKCGICAPEAMCEDFDSGLFSRRPDLSDRGELACLGLVREMAQDALSFAFAHIKDLTVNRIHVRIDVVTESPSHVGWNCSD